MRKTSKTIVFFGSGPVAKASLDHLARSWHIEAVYTKPSTQALMATDLPDVPVRTCINKAELNASLAEHPPSSQLGVVVDFGIIISQEIINSFPLGIINAHFSLLPEWRGADPISHAILSGQSQTGVSLMRISAGLDEGDLLALESCNIEPKWTTGDLTTALINLSNSMLERYLPAYLEGKLLPFPQDTDVTATYARKLTKEDSLLCWNKPAAVLEREIRAFQPWPRSHAKFGQVDCLILEAEIEIPPEPLPPGRLSIANKRLLVGCGDGQALSITTIQPAGKKAMPITAFLAGYASKLKANN